MSFDYDKIQRELDWLKDNPHFSEKPASMPEFLGEGYLNIDKGIRTGVRGELIELFGKETNPHRISVFERAMFTGAIGIGKTTMASVILPYMAHWVLCLKDPQGFYDLLPGSRIAFMQMSTSEDQALETIFGDIKARIEHSEWFANNYPFDPKFTKQIRFKQKDIWILPGNSAETTFEGYNILGGILDEADSHKKTKEKDYADIGYDCVDRDTEILTRRGWVYHTDLSEQDQVYTLNHETGEGEWNEVEEVRRFEVEDEELVSMESSRFSSLTTKNHRWPVIDNRGNRRWSTSSTLKTGQAIQLSAVNSNIPIEPKYSDDLVELVAWTYTEGHRQNNTLSLYQNEETQGISRIRSCLRGIFGEPLKSGSKIPFRWRESTRSDRPLVNFHLDVYASSVILEHMDNKIPTCEFLANLTRAQLELFIYVSLLADNCGEGRFAQKDYAAAEAFAFAAILSGRSVSIREHFDHKANYKSLLVTLRKQVQVKPVDTARKLQNSNMTIEPKFYTGTIWCPRTRNKSWLARRKGSVYFTGNTIDNRISSRYEDRGFLLVIGQMKSATGFASKKFNEFQRMENAHTVRMTIWESRGWENYLNPDGSRDSFWYDSKRKEIVEKSMAELIAIDSANLIEVPNKYRQNFENNPEKSLRDLAGIPPASGDAFISLSYKIDEAVQRWQERYDYIGSPVTDDTTRPQFEDWFSAPDSLRRAVHIDLAYSDKGDALAIAMGHVHHIVTVDTEDKPYIVFDFLLRMKAAPGTEIMLADARRIIYDLKDEFGFKIRMITMDGFQSTETKQQLRKRRYQTEYVSVDKSKLPYEDLRDALYEDRIEFPPYETYLFKGADERVQIATKEISELEDHDKKVDHPVNGSKDVADAIAGVTTTLMGDRTYRRGIRSATNAATESSGDDSYAPTVPSDVQKSGMPGMIPGGLQAPVPPNVLPGQIPSMPIPPGLTRRDR